MKKSIIHVLLNKSSWIWIFLIPVIPICSFFVDKHTLNIISIFFAFPLFIFAFLSPFAICFNCGSFRVWRALDGIGDKPLETTIDNIQKAYWGGMCPVCGFSDRDQGDDRVD